MDKGRETLLARERSCVIQVIEELRHYRKKNVYLESLVNEYKREKIKLERDVQQSANKIQILCEESVNLAANNCQNVGILHFELSYDAEQTSNQLKRFEKLLHEGQTGNDHNLKAALESCERTVAGLKQEIADMCAERGNLEQKLSCAEQQLSVSKKKIEELTRRLAQFHNCADKLEAHLTEVTGVQNRMEENLTVATAINENLFYALQHKDCVISELTKERDSLLHQVCHAKADAVDDEQSKKNDDVTVPRSQYFELQAKISSLESEKSTLEDELARCRKAADEANVKAEKAYRMLNHYCDTDGCESLKLVEKSHLKSEDQ